MRLKARYGITATVCAVMVVIAVMEWRAPNSPATGPANNQVTSLTPPGQPSHVTVTPAIHALPRNTNSLAAQRRNFVAVPRTIGTPGKPDQVIELEGVRILTGGNPSKVIRGTPGEATVYLVQFIGAIQPVWRARVEQLGGTVHGYLPQNSLSVELTPSAAKQLIRESFVHWLQPVEPDHKVQPFLASLLDATTVEKLPVTISTYSARDAEGVAESLRSAGIDVIAAETGKRWGWVRAEVAPDQVMTIAALDRVQWIEEYVTPQLFNDLAANGAHLRATNVWYARGLTGQGQIIGHADTGLDVGTFTNLHQDLTGRVVMAFARGRANLWNDPNGHGTHTAGSILGNGTMSTGVFRGVAWQAGLVHQSLLDSGGGLGGLPDDLNELYLQAYTNGARVHSDSWGSSVFGAYTASSRQSDEFMWDHPDMLLVFSAGNDGYDSNDGVVDPDSLGSPATAKNVLTVGAAESDRPSGSGGFSSLTYGSIWLPYYFYDPIRDDLISQSASGTHQGIAAFSSRGPTDDGRIKPDVVASGTDIVSIRSRASGSTGWGVNNNTNYIFNGGTSMSAPLVAGAAALVREYFQEYRDDPSPSAALVKAVLQHGARPMAPGQYGTGATQEVPDSIPNIVTGWGHVDVESSLFPSALSWFYQDERTGLSTPGERREIVFYASTGTVKVSLNYTDFPATAGSALKLVNDLDLSLHGPGGITNFAGQDRINPAEQIRRVITVAGVYTARVEAINVPDGPQPFALVISGPVIDQPIIRHTPTGNTFATNLPYRVTAEVIASAPLPTNAVSLYWKNSADTGSFNRVVMSPVTGHWYEANIPAMPNPSEVQYYFAVSSAVFTVTHPAGAPDSTHRYLVTGPLSLTVNGNPAPVFSVSPNYGSHLFASGLVMRLSAPASSNLSPGMRVAVTGWTGSGNVPASGTGHEVDIVLREDSAITWFWETQYMLTQTSTVPGIVQTATWWGVWAMASTLPAPMETTYLGTNYGFTGWTIDGQRQPNAGAVAANPAAGIAMYGPRVASAAYMRANIDANVDGIPDWWTQFYFGTNITTANTDSDSDGFTNATEYKDRTNPRDPGSVPTPPQIIHTPPGPFVPRPSPWTITADITDNYDVASALVRGRTNGGAWASNPLVDAGSNRYEGLLHIPATNGSVISYEIEAKDAAGLVATSTLYSFTISYPLLQASPANFGEIRLPDETQTNAWLVISNSGLGQLHWIVERAVHFDAMEGGTGAWTHAGANDVWHLQQSRYASATSAWHLGEGPSGQYADSTHAWLVTEPVRLDAAAWLVFDHWASMEYDTEQLDEHYWDGGVVEISTNDGADWIMIDPAGGYPHKITNNPDSPFPAETPCYGATDGWQPAAFDLSAFAGETVRVRFRFGSDKYVTEEGWYIDNVKVVFSDNSPWQWLDVVTNGIVSAAQASNETVVLDSAPLELAEHRTSTLLIYSDDPIRDAPVQIPIELHNISRRITVSRNANGFINPDGSVLVNEGDSLMVYMQGDTFYEIGEVQTNESAVENFVRVDATNFTWAGIVSNGTMRVVFMEKMAAGLVPEWWLYEQGLTNGTPANEAVGDTDGDGMVAWQEYRAATNPNDSNSVALLVYSATPVTWLSFTNTALRYEIERTTNLVDGFVLIATNIPATPPVNAFTNPGAPAGFEIYRVRALPEP